MGLLIDQQMSSDKEEDKSTILRIIMDWGFRWQGQASIKVYEMDFEPSLSLLLRHNVSSLPVKYGLNGVLLLEPFYLRWNVA